MVQKDFDLGKTGYVPPLDLKQLRDWWHNILRKHDRYLCYAVFLAFSSDKAVLNYLMVSHDELDILSGENCLVLVFNDSGFLSMGPNQKLWDVILAEHFGKGYSAKFAEIFQVRYDAFPCLLLFDDVRSRKYVEVSLKGLNVDEISLVMRSTFTTINQAILASQNPLEALIDTQKKLENQKTSKAVFQVIGQIADHTLKKSIEAIIETIVPK